MVLNFAFQQSKHPGMTTPKKQHKNQNHLTQFAVSEESLLDILNETQLEAKQEGAFGPEQDEHYFECVFDVGGRKPRLHG